MSTRRQRNVSGASLIELLAAIVVVSVALTGMLAIFVETGRHSANPMVQEQAQLIAEAYLDEILIKRFYDPDTDTVCPAPEGTGRSTYDNVCDYTGLNQAPTNQFGTAITGLGAPYNVRVTVTTAGVSLTGVAPGPVTTTIDNTGATRVMRVEVVVTGPANVAVALTGYRTNYECNLATDAGCKP